MRIDCKILPNKKKKKKEEEGYVPSGDIERRQKRNEMDQEKSWVVTEKRDWAVGIENC